MWVGTSDVKSDTSSVKSVATDEKNKKNKKNKKKKLKKHLPRIPKDGQTRVVFGNMNGSRMDAPWSKFQSSLKDLISLDCDLVGLSEHNVDTLKPHIVGRMKTDVTSQFQHSHVVMSSSPVHSSGIRKPGGTLSMAFGDIVGRVSSTTTDSLGRWTAQHLKGKGGTVVTVVSVYQACPNTGSPMTVWNQQRAALAADHRQITPKAAFAEDLREFLRECTSKKHLLIVGGDFNETLEKHGILHDLCSDQALNLMDVIGLRHPEALSVATHNRSESRRVDYILMSTALSSSVNACGYLPFNDMASDHRFSYLDLDTSSVFGDPAKLAPLPQRSFQANNPTLVTKYLEALSKYLDHQNFWPRLEKLKELVEPDHELAERLDKVLLDGKLHAEKQCRYDRRFWWSLPLAKEEEHVRFYNAALTALRKNRPVPPRSQRRQKLTPIEPTIPTTVHEASQLLQSSRHKRDEIRRESRMFRDEFAIHLANKAEADDNPELAKVHRDRHRTEVNNRVWKRLKVMKDNPRSALTHIEVPFSHADGKGDPLENPKTAVQFTIVDKVEEMEPMLGKRNSGHFEQAQGTPFTIAPLSEDFDWAASTHSAELVLDGTYDSATLPELQKEFLSRCKLRIVAPETADLPLLTEEEWRHRVRRWKERTSTSPSGLHLGHVKALTSTFSVNRQCDRGADLAEFQQKMITAHVALINYATKFKHSYDRWKTIVNVMIQKEAGNSKIHRLRVIHLYEYDFSIYLAVHWKKMMRDAESRGAINDGQYGGRKNKNPQSLVLFEELKNEICHFSRKSLVNFDNDAASCYDRILPSVASLLGRTQGLHKHVIFVHATTLREARYKLRTALGVSESFTTHCDLKPWYGTGQGSTNSPMIWTLVSSALYDIHNDQAHGAEFLSPDGKIHIRLTIVGFVDDSNCNTNLFRDNDQSRLSELVCKATHDAQLWADLLWLSGGLLELPKCSYHILHYSFNGNAKPYLSQSVQEPIRLTAADGSEVLIQQHSVTAAHKTLGHLKAPDDAGKNQLEAITAWCKHQTAKVHRFPLRPSDAYVLYHQVLTPKYTYLIPQGYHSKRKLTEASSGLQQECARASGYSGSMKTAIRYGPASLGGAGFIEFYTHQGRGQVLNLLRCLRSDTMLKRIWICALSWAQLSAGVDFAILERPKVSIPYLEGNYIKSLRQFLASTDGSLSFSNLTIPCTHRPGDFHLMSFALKHMKNMTLQKWHILNCTRLYFQVVTVSDIAKMDGKSVNREYDVHCTNVRPPRHHSMARTKWLHVNQPRLPRNAQRAVWRTLIRLIDKYLFARHLGPWTLPPSKQRMRWPMYFDHQTRTIFYQPPDSDVYFQYDEASVSKSKSHAYYQYVRTTTTVPFVSDSCRLKD